MIASKLAKFANGCGCACEDSTSPGRNMTQCHSDPPPRCALPFTVRCAIVENENRNEDTPGRRLINVDAMEEMCFFPKNEDDIDCYNVCDCCGVITKYCSGYEGDEGCKPVKYARRQRFTFKDDRTGCVPPPPPWPFKCETLSCPPQRCCNQSCKEDCVGSNVPASAEPGGLPCQSGVYYYNKTENKLVLQTRNVCKETPPATPKAPDSAEVCDEFEKPVVIQPLLIPNGGTPSYPTQPSPCCPSPPFCGPCCTAPRCDPCYPPPCCGPCCPPPWCCNPWCPPPPTCCYFPPYCSPCCGPPPGGPCCPPPGCHPCCPPPPPPPPPPPAQTTVIPMCIPINPPQAPRVPCKNNGKFNETVIELQKGGCGACAPVCC